MPSSIEKGLQVLCSLLVAALTNDTEVDLERAQARLRQLGIPENNASV